METLNLILLLYIIISTSGILLNLFISVISYRTWLSRGFENPQGLLLFFTGLSNAIFGAVQISFDVIIFLELYFWTVNVCIVLFHCVYTFCMLFNTCQTSWLCSFYCIKLVSFQHWVIKVLKLRLPSVLPRLMIGTLVISVIVLVSSLSVIFTSVPVDNTNNSTFYCSTICEDYFDQIVFINAGLNFMVALPFCLILVSLSCTISSLVQHIRRVKGTLSLDGSHLEAHVDAVKTMMLLLVLSASFYVSKSLLEWNSLPDTWYWICVIMFYLCCPLQALILITGTKKLYRHFICCLYRRSSEKM